MVTEYFPLGTGRRPGQAMEQICAVAVDVPHALGSSASTAFSQPNDLERVRETG